MDYSNSFPDFCEEFEKDKVSLGVKEFGISITTLEDVFINIGKLLNPMSQNA